MSLGYLEIAFDLVCKMSDYLLMNLHLGERNSALRVGGAAGKCDYFLPLRAFGLLWEGIGRTKRFNVEKGMLLMRKTGAPAASWIPNPELSPILRIPKRTLGEAPSRSTVRRNVITLIQILNS